MPITKERLLSLVNAGESIELIYSTTCQTILDNCLRARRGEQSKDDALDIIEQIVTAYEVQIFPASRALFKERTWYNLTHRRAEREAAYQNRRRRTEGVPAKPLLDPARRIINPTPKNYVPTTYEYIKAQEAIGLSAEEALHFLEKHNKSWEEPAEAKEEIDSLTPQAAFEPSVEDTDGWALPSADDPDDDSDAEG